MGDDVAAACVFAPGLVGQRPEDDPLDKFMYMLIAALVAAMLLAREHALVVSAAALSTGCRCGRCMSDRCWPMRRWRLRYAACTPARGSWLLHGVSPQPRTSAGTSTFRAKWPSSQGVPLAGPRSDPAHLDWQYNIQ